MKFLKRFAIVLLFVLVAGGIYYASYRFYLYKFGNEDKEKFANNLSERTIEASSAENQKITPRTKLVIEHYNRTDGTVTEEQSTMPVTYVGMEREQLTTYLEEYARAPSLSDVEAGFEKYQILSFSDKEVVLRKIATPVGTAYKYYLAEDNGCVTVYYIDKQTVYEYTNILVDMLPADVAEQIIRGKYVTDEEALYDFLETYTS